ncbi:ABC transporter permease [Pelistega sp. NLN82]|uniref:ABC transporter permease n=1 Tax=Pelistega ratti TaxID=2652177 RepID=A0A6L9Y846_9BURK|nr:methionine ABC transporter permease [Pelistega ratti]NEN75954.1 ABC transporter permease [Pelistega ratti]
MNWSVINWDQIGQGTIDTLLMVLIPMPFIVFIGIPIGMYLFLISEGQLLENKTAYRLLSFVVNVLRSIPFIILIMAVMPLSKLIVGTSIGVAGVITPLVIGAVAFFVRLVENVLRELDPGIIEASKAMGATPFQTVVYSLLPESLTGIISAITVTAIALVGYSAMAGVLGAGGLGDIAVRYGYQRFQYEMMYATVVIIVIMVQLMQMIGDYFVARFTRK